MEPSRQSDDKTVVPDFLRNTRFGFRIPGIQRKTCCFLVKFSIALDFGNRFLQSKLRRKFGLYSLALQAGGWRFDPARLQS